MKLLFGSYELSIDEKNRMLIPVEVRRALDPVTDGESLYLVTGINGKLWLWPEKHYERLAEGRGSEMIPDEATLEFDQLSFALARRLEWDKQGRVVFPEKELKKAGLKKEVTLAGARDHLELWDRAEWSAREQELERRRVEIAAKAKQRPSAV